MAGLHDHMDHDTAEHHTQQHVEKGRDFGDALEARRTIGEVKAQHRVDIGQHHTDDLAKAQRDDGKVVTF
ncbi:hypothetical protein SDC9_145732 [bioreactor metagenome]|uniref:Uncharacterized protein n=1 Tax=bioreactor metagenome TaxID=1076179 RepID=A0A645E967_9ZZZZ